MFQSRKERQNEMEIVTIEELVPENHLPRKIDQYIDFSFILEKVREQALLTAACQNMKKIALHLTKVSLVKESLFW
ncbi:hypothetical protein [Halobacillus sp. A5]|uniref:hypothetical protein n=1 Tax=Halobacillus sp. A5 TaxID=2880263 RepID=UPI0020A6673A|nr:hypothetical protein [Halobacillus sp. A5]MCP3026570.1 hypothetical protein [Halobacillus sp. A5]